MTVTVGLSGANVIGAPEGLNVSQAVRGVCGNRDWTLEDARRVWTPMWRPTQQIGIPGYDWQPMALWDGSIIFGPSQYARSGAPVEKEAQATVGDNQMHMCFAFGDTMTFVDRTGRRSPAIRRELQDGSLPIPRIQTRMGDLVWDEVVFSHLLGRRMEEGLQPRLDDKLIVHCIFNVTNRCYARKTARLWMYLSDLHTSSFAYESTVSAGLGTPIKSRYNPPFGLVGDLVRYAIPPPAAGKLRWHDQTPVTLLNTNVSEAAAAASGMVGARHLAEPAATSADNVLEWEVELAPGQSAELRILAPLGPVDRQTGEEIARLDSHARLAEVAGWWRSFEGGEGQIHTPDSFVNSYVRAVAGQTAQQVAYRRLARQWHYKTSPNVNEMYWPCNGGMGAPTFDLRGHREMSEPVLQTFIDTQTDDVGALPTDRTGTAEGTLGGEGSVGGEGFARVPGFLGNVGEWTSNTLLLSHGVELWALASHYRITRDDRWLGKGPGSALQAMLDGFDWVITQRKRTMREVDGHRVAHWGLLPAASAHDWFSGNTIFNDAYCIFGMIEVARLLNEIGHPRAADMQRELNDYRACLRERYIEARDKARPVPLSDDSQIPYVPRDVYELDWRRIDWTYTGYGPLRAGAWGAIDPQDELIDQTLAFLEAGMPRGEGPYLHLRPFCADENWEDVSDRSADRHWIWRHYVEFETMWPVGYHLFLARDDLPRFFEWLFNNLAVTIHPDWLVGVEALDGTPSNAPGDAERWRAVRDMFVNERGGYDGSRQSLWLLQAIPQSWLKPGCHSFVKRMPTYFGGHVDLDLTAEEDSVSVQIDIDGLKVKPSEVRVRLRSRDGRPLIRAAVNGRSVPALEADTIRLPEDLSGSYHVTGWFR